ncbi:MAG: FAD-binding protein [Myxococcales bacterium]|nr:FAD-binding protein [Myxococcales bacterium]
MLRATTAPARWDLEVDVVAVGSGLGAMSGAIAAHDAGASVAILEKAPKLGGVCAYSGGEVFVGCNHKLTEEGRPDDPAAAKAYLDFLAGGYAEPELARILFERGPEVARYLEERAGVRWKIIKDFPDYHYPHAPGTAASGRYLEVELFEGAQLGPWQKKTYLTPHMPPGITHDELFAWGGLATITKWDFALMGKRVAKDLRGMGPGMMGYFVKAAVIDRGVAAHVGTPARELVVDGGRVVGVRAERDGAAFWVRARRGVLLATGGYDWNPRLARQYEQLPEWHSMCQPSVEGDNIVLGGEVGAALARVPSHNLGMFFGYRIPGEEHDGKPLYRASWEGGYPHAIWVNRAGQRFADESFYRDYLPKCRSWDGLRQDHPNYPPFLIFDQSYRDKYAFATYMPGMEVPEEVLARGATLRELAGKLGVDADGLEATVARFNRFAVEGADPDFGRGSYPWAAVMTGDKSRPNPNVGPLDRGPFYGVALVPVGVGVNSVGLDTDASARVRHVRGAPIPGLYACGNAAAALDTGAGYQSGLSNVRGMTWGFIAGQHMASGAA